ncbi:MAG: MFS transporter [Bifidobacteriaceae bacterium]|jgi:MFS family permease|nr:MFS transporter [Bifidobacteriaceae bacterium]
MNNRHQHNSSPVDQVKPSDQRKNANRLPITVWIMAGISLSVALGFGIVAPVLPTFAKQFGVSNFAASAVVAVFAGVRLLCSPLVGRWTVRFTPRNVLECGLLIVAASSALAGLADNYWQLLVLRGAGGLGSAMFSVSGMTLLLGAVQPNQRGRSVALYQGGFLVGAIAGPGLGGIVSAISLRAPFFFYAGTLVLAAVVALALRRLPRNPNQSTTKAVTSLAGIMRNRDYQAAMLANLCHGWTSHGLRSALVPLLVAQVIYSNPETATRMTGVAMAVAAAVQAIAVWPAGQIVDRLGRRAPILFGSIASAIAFSLLPLCRSIVPLTVALAAYALASATLGSAPAAVVGDVAGPQGGRAVAWFSMMADIGGLTAPLVGGLLADSLGFRAALWSGCLFWLASAVLAWRMPDAATQAKRERVNRG